MLTDKSCDSLIIASSEVPASPEGSGDEFGFPIENSIQSLDSAEDEPVAKIQGKASKRDPTRKRNAINSKR